MSNLIFPASPIPVKIFGDGKEVLFAFPGYNSSAYDFKILESSLGKHYKIIAFDLFYSDFENQYELFSYKDLEKIILDFISLNNINKFSLAGYSFGGKLALACVELFPERIKDVFLFAPDGIKTSIIYKIVSKTRLGRYLFKKIIKNPSPLFKIVDFLKKTSIINHQLYRFVYTHMESQKQREKVLQIWTIFRNINPSIRIIQKCINTHDINIHLFFGRYDKIIPYKIGTNFLKALNKKDSLHILNIGHRLINKELNDYLINFLQKNKRY